MVEFNSAASSRSGFVDELALARQKRENTTASDAPNSGTPRLHDQDIAPDAQRNTDAPDAETIRQARIEIARRDALNATGPFSPETMERRQHDELVRQLAARLPGFTTQQLKWLEYAFNNVGRAANPQLGNEINHA